MPVSGTIPYRDSSYVKSTLAVSVQLLLPHGIKMVLYIYRSQPVCPTFLAGRYVAGESRWKSYHIRPTYPLYIEMLMLRGVGRLRVVKLALSLSLASLCSSISSWLYQNRHEPKIRHSYFIFVEEHTGMYEWIASAALTLGSR